MWGAALIGSSGRKGTQVSRARRLPAATTTVLYMLVMEVTRLHSLMMCVPSSQGPYQALGRALLLRSTVLFCRQV